MKEKKNRYDADLEKEIAQVNLEGRRTAPSLASEFGVHVNTICKWVQSGCPMPCDRDAGMLAQIRKIERDNDYNYGVRPCTALLTMNMGYAADTAKQPE